MKIKFKGTEIDERFNIIKRNGVIKLFTLVELEGSEKIRKQGFDVLGKHQAFRFSTVISESEVESILKDFRALGDDNFGIILEQKIFGNSASSRDYRDYPHIFYIGGDITDLLFDILNNRAEVGIFTNIKGRVTLRMTKRFAEPRGYGKYEYLIRTASVSSSLDKNKKSVRFFYQLDLNPLACAMLAKHIWYINKLLAKRMLLFSGDYMDTELNLSKKGKKYQFNKQTVRGAKND